MSSALQTLLQNPAIWRGDEQARVQLPSIPTGFAELDRELPGGGWPRGVVSELLTERSGIGELSLFVPALANLSREDGWLMLIAPPWIPYAPALAARGIRLSKLVVVDTRSDKDTLWAAEQGLRAGNCSAVLAWPAAINERSLRRLQLAAEEGGSFGAMFGAAAAGCRRCCSTSSAIVQPRRCPLPGSGNRLRMPAPGKDKNLNAFDL